VKATEVTAGLTERNGSLLPVGGVVVVGGVAQW